MENVAYPWPDPEIPTFDDNGLMVPPWFKYPNLPRASMGWRMGQDEEYWDEFRAWWWKQFRVTRLRVKEAYPELEKWTGFYESP